MESPEAVISVTGASREWGYTQRSVGTCSEELSSVDRPPLPVSCGAGGQLAALWQR